MKRKTLLALSFFTLLISCDFSKKNGLIKTEENSESKIDGAKEFKFGMQGPISGFDCSLEEDTIYNLDCVLAKVSNMERLKGMICKPKNPIYKTDEIRIGHICLTPKTQKIYEIDMNLPGSVLHKDKHELILRTYVEKYGQGKITDEGSLTFFSGKNWIMIHDSGPMVGIISTAAYVSQDLYDQALNEAKVIREDRMKAISKEININKEDL